MSEPDPLAAHAEVHEPSRPRGALARFSGFLEERVILNLATALMLGAMGLMFYEASSRTLLSESHWWAEESVRFLVVWSVMLSLGIATRKGNYVRMGLFIDAMPRSVQRAAAWIGCIAGIAFSVMVVIAGTLERHSSPPRRDANRVQSRSAALDRTSRPADRRGPLCDLLHRCRFRPASRPGRSPADRAMKKQ